MDDGCLLGRATVGERVSEENVVRTSDFLLMHGNGVRDPNRIARDGSAGATGAGLPNDANPVQRG